MARSTSALPPDEGGLRRPLSELIARRGRDADTTEFAGKSLSFSTVVSQDIGSDLRAVEASIRGGLTKLAVSIPKNCAGCGLMRVRGEESPDIYSFAKRVAMDVSCTARSATHCLRATPVEVESDGPSWDLPPGVKKISMGLHMPSMTPDDFRREYASNFEYEEPPLRNPRFTEPAKPADSPRTKAALVW